MLALLVNVLGPVAVIVVLGAVIAHVHRIEPEPLSRLAYWFLGPAFMFDVLHDADLAPGVIAQLVLVGLAGMVAAATVAGLVLRATGHRYEPVAAGAMTAAYGNVGNAGLAISAFALGPEALPIAGVFMLAINVTGMMFGIGLAHGRKGSFTGAARQALLAPMTITSLVAILVNVTGWAPPLLADRTVGLISGALIPTMLFTLGAQLRRTGWPRPTLTSLIPLAAKLALAPAAAALVARALGLEGDLFAVAIIQSAMPPAVFCMVVAIEHDLEPETVTATVALSTLASVLTLPPVLWLVA